MSEQNFTTKSSTPPIFQLCILVCDNLKAKRLRLYIINIKYSLLEYGRGKGFLSKFSAPAFSGIENLEKAL